MPVSKVPQFLVEADEAVSRLVPGARFVSFGHLGDGNIHYNVSQPIGMDKAKFLDLWNAMNDVVFDVVGSFNGSISAEHGIGTLKAHRMPEIKSRRGTRHDAGPEAHARSQRHPEPGPRAAGVIRAGSAGPASSAGRAADHRGREGEAVIRCRADELLRLLRLARQPGFIIFAPR